jgi:serine/threonine protein kinase
VHEHLVRLIGVVTLGDPIMAVLEYCEHGSLDSYLKKTEVSDDIKVRACVVVGA